MVKQTNNFACNLLHFTASSATSDEDENCKFSDNPEKYSEKHVKGVPFSDAPKGGMYKWMIMHCEGWWFFKLFNINIENDFRRIKLGCRINFNSYMANFLTIQRSILKKM